MAELTQACEDKKWGERRMMSPTLGPHREERQGINEVNKANFFPSVFWVWLQSHVTQKEFLTYLPR